MSRRERERERDRETEDSLYKAQTMLKGENKRQY